MVKKEEHEIEIEMNFILGNIFVPCLHFMNRFYDAADSLNAKLLNFLCIIFVSSSLFLLISVIFKETIKPVRQWQIQDFQTGCANPKVGALTYYLTKYFPKLHENEKKIDRGAHPCRPC